MMHLSATLHRTHIRYTDRGDIVGIAWLPRLADKVDKVESVMLEVESVGFEWALRVLVSPL